MPVTMKHALTHALARMRRRAAQDDGFTLIAVLGVLLVATLLVTATFVAAQGDTHLTQHDLDQKRAYAATRSGVNEFLHHLNQDSNYWAGCPSQGGPVPGSSASDNLTYSYQPVPANGASSCRTTDPIGTMVDSSTGSFQMRFTGTSGGSSPAPHSLVASFGRNSPLDYLWYTVYETLDPYAYSNPQNYLDCGKFHRPPDARPDRCGNIDWISGDVVKGPMYTQDQFAICGYPEFGRPSRNDKIESLAADPTFSDCSLGDHAIVHGQLLKGPAIPLPTYNTQLQDDAANGQGWVFHGPTDIELQGDSATVTQLDSAGNPTQQTLPLNGSQVMYVANGTANCNSTYDPHNVTSYALSASGGCGNAYVHGGYSKSLTIAAANDIILGDPNGFKVTDDIKSQNDGAMLGLVANDFVRVMHGCSNDRNILSYTRPNFEIDAAILALAHSFIVDNYDCGSPVQNLVVNGAIAQKFRGTVGTHRGGDVSSGYLKQYSYDDRLASQEPPYLFDLEDASWHINRETQCEPTSSDPANGCG